ncbi:hypothetical protein NST21_11295 [Peribacillus sp. FSL K6-1552]|uniref:hypothetical protein n=1 Tax=Peribacillus sp. FSL K6-1552 TaxID=2954514 RepID=UPI0030F883AD
MKVFALVGKSGTGKSTSVLQYTHKKGIPAFIDDGLLIVKGRKIAGTSAKYEKNYIKAVKRAIFHYDEHQEEVIKAIHRASIDKILIVGTSIKMVDLIAQKLKLGKIDQYTDVSNIRSSKEIKMALFVRKTEEKHVIPIPYIQIEPSMVKKIILKGKKIFSNQKIYIGETTIIQPNFNKGTIFISETALKDITIFSCKNLVEVSKVSNIRYNFSNVPKLQIQVELVSSIDQNIIKMIEMIQEKITFILLSVLEIELDSIDVYISSLTLEKD